MTSGSTRRTWRHVASIGLLSLPLCACGSPPPQVTTFDVIDSAGVAITSSTSPVWADGDEWRIASEPEVVIGRGDGDERYLLSDVLSVRRFSDGRIAVLDGGSSRVRIYDGEGRHLVDMGGPGEGPYEFSREQYLDLVNDTVFVYESSPGTITVFSGDGNFLRMGPSPRPPSGRVLFGAAFGVLHGESLVVAGYPPGRPERTLELTRQEMSIWRLSLRGSEADSLMVILSDEAVMDDWEGRVRIRDVLFGKTTYFTASDSHLYVGDSDTYGIRVHDAQGVLKQAIRRVVEPRLVGPGDLERHVRQTARLAGNPDSMITVALQRMREFPIADAMPAFRQLIADSDGNLWVEDWDDVGVEQGRFSVFRADGAWLGRVDLPPGLPWLRARGVYTSLLEIGADFVLGVWVDDLGVEQVRKYRISKGADAR